MSNLTDVQKVRRKKLQELLDTKFGGSKAKLNRALSRAETFVHGRLDTGPKGKPIGERLARHIERMCGLKDYELDGMEQIVHVPLRKKSAMGDVKLVAGSQRRPLPVLSPEQAARSREAVKAYRSNAKGYRAMVPDKQYSEWAFFMQVVGDAMEPLFHDGDFLVIDPDVKPKPGDFVCAKCNGQVEATFKKYRPMDGSGIFELVPLNENYSTISSDRVKCRVEGTMVEHHSYRKS